MSRIGRNITFLFNNLGRLLLNSVVLLLIKMLMANLKASVADTDIKTQSTKELKDTKMLNALIFNCSFKKRP